MKTKGEVEAAICLAIARFQQEHMGRGPSDIQAYLVGEMILVRLKGVLTVAEQQLVSALPSDKGRDLIKQVRTHLIETARPVMEPMIETIVAVGIESLHHDISTRIGEEVIVFTLKEAPKFRAPKR